MAKKKNTEKLPIKIGKHEMIWKSDKTRGEKKDEQKRGKKNNHKKETKKREIYKQSLKNN